MPSQATVLIKEIIIMKTSTLLCTSILFIATQASANFCIILDRGLCAASCAGDQESALLRIAGADEGDRVCALALAASPEMQTLLIQNGVSPDTRTVYGNRNSPAGRTALFRIIFRGDFPLFSNLIGAGVDVNLADVRGRTALMQAAGQGRLEMVQALLAAKADVQAVDRFGDSALCHAQKYLFVPNRAEIMGLLQAAGGTCR
jgi:ankyrin repeat protein